MEAKHLKGQLTPAEQVWVEEIVPLQKGQWRGDGARHVCLGNGKQKKVEYRSWMNLMKLYIV